MNIGGVLLCPVGSWQLIAGFSFTLFVGPKSKEVVMVSAAHCNYVCKVGIQYFLEDFPTLSGNKRKQRVHQDDL